MYWCTVHTVSFMLCCQPLLYFVFVYSVLVYSAYWVCHTLSTFTLACLLCTVHSGSVVNHPVPVQPPNLKIHIYFVLVLCVCGYCTCWICHASCMFGPCPPPIFNIHISETHCQVFISIIWKVNSKKLQVKDEKIGRHFKAILIFNI